MFLKSLACGACMGCLTPVQLAKIMCAAFPVPVPLSALAQEVASQWEEQQQQQAQRGAAPRRR